jgi:hypothetical protein
MKYEILSHAAIIKKVVEIHLVLVFSWNMMSLKNLGKYTGIFKKVRKVRSEQVHREF